MWALDAGHERTREGHSGYVAGVTATPDGKRVVSASWDKTLKLWNVETGRVMRTMEGHADRVRGVAVTPVGKKVVSASWDTTLRLWDLETGCVLRTMDGHPWGVNGVAVTADGKQAVFRVCGYDSKGVGPGNRPGAAHSGRSLLVRQ